MKQTFGAFIKEKRIHKMIRLNTFAKFIGISPVYLSYIENGKRPAPSEKVLHEIIKSLDLKAVEAEKLLLLAAETHNRPALPDEIVDYINNNEYVMSALNTAIKYKASDTIWSDLVYRIKSAYYDKYSDK